MDDPTLAATGADLDLSKIKPVDAPSPVSAATLPGDPVAPVDARSGPVDAGIQKWVDTFMRDSPLSRHVEAWNHLTSHLAVLRDAIIAEL